MVRRLGIFSARGLMALGLFAVMLAVSIGGGAAAKPAKEVFGAVAAPSEGASASVGGYAKGCLAGAIALAETGPGRLWQAMRLSRRRNYGHPEMIAFIERLAARAAAIGWSGLLVGDISQPRGGPMRTGHASHQIGIDADIWLTPAPAGRALTAEEREAVSAVAIVDADKRTLTPAWTPAHALLLRAAADDPAVARVFVNPAIKKRVCVDEAAAGASTEWLAKLRPWWGHDRHFHVRLACPADSPACVAQDPIPPGDGCREVDEWLTDEALFPKPRPDASPPRKKPPITLADLPPACRALVGE